MAELFRQVFHEQDGTVFYDLPIDGTFDSPGLAARADASLEHDATVRVTVIRADEKPHTLTVRVPEWAESASFPGEASRVWKPGDSVVVTYRLRTRTVARDRRVALFRGPWLLAVDQSTSPNYFDEPSAQNRVQLPAESDTAVTSMTLRYLPGGYPVQPQLLTLRPMGGYRRLPEGTRLEFWLPR
jgi:DUF1680 family protein